MKRMRTRTAYFYVGAMKMIWSNNMYICRIVILVISLSFISCASYSVRNNTISFLEKGEYEKAFNYIENSILYNEEAKEYVKLFKKDYPKSLPYIVMYYRKQINESDSKYEVLSLPKRLKVMQQYGLIPIDQYKQLFDYLNKAAEERNQNNSIEFLLSDNYKKIPSLAEKSNEIIIFKRSVDSLVDTNSDTLARMVIESVKVSGTNSEKYLYLKENLPKIRLSHEILKGDFQSLYPEIAESRINKLVIKIKLISSPPNEDYLFEIEEYLQKNNNVQLVDTENAETYVLEINKLRLRERDLPERTQTISYATYQVNFAAAVLLMPRNATYLYDHNTGGFEISYSFLIKLFKDGDELVNKKIKGKKEEKYSYCTNTRIRNVFGGISPAQFIANEDMRYRCLSDKRSVDTEKVYGEVMEEVANKILELQPISNRIHYGI